MHMIISFSMIKKIKKLVSNYENVCNDQSDGLKAYLNKNEFPESTLLLIADSIGHSLPVTIENADDLEWFGNLLRTVFYNKIKCIYIFIEILKVVAHKTTIYHVLMDIYFYDVLTITNFDFLGNVISQLSKPIPGLDPLYYCMSYTYIGMIFQRLGRFWDARSAYNMAVSFRDDPRKISKTAEYANLELDYLASINGMNLLQEKSRMLNDKPLLIIGTVLFGARYEKLFRTIAGATFFCNRNLAQLKTRWRPILVVFCSLFDKINLQNTDFYKKLSSELQIKIIIFPEVLISNHPDPIKSGEKYSPPLVYSLSGLLQTCLIVLARKCNADLINLPPDAVFTNQTGTEIIKNVQNGSKVIFTPGIRLKRNEIVQSLSELKRDSNEFSIDISSEELTELALANLHPAIKACFFTNERITHPGILMWDINGKGLICHSFQMHPIFVNAELLKNSPVKRFNSIDGDFVNGMLPCPSDWKHIHIVNNKSHCIMFELSGPEVPFELCYSTKNIVKSAGSWIANTMRPLNFWLLKRGVQFGNVTTQDSLEIKKQVDKTISEILKLRDSVEHQVIFDIQASCKQGDEQLELLTKTFINDLSKKKPMLQNRFITQSVQSLSVIFSVVVWGRDYIDTFLKLCLPSMLSEGNIASLNNEHSLFILHTKEEDIPIFDNNIHFKKLKMLISVEIKNINIPDGMDKYTILSRAQSEAVQLSKNFDVICFLYSDFVWATGSMQFSLQKIANGYDGVISPVPPIIKEKFYEMLHENYEDFITYDDKYIPSYLINANSRKLIHHVKPIMHPMMRDNNIDYKINTGNPAYVLWFGPNEDLLIRCFHSHPVMLKVKPFCPEYCTPFEKTLDEYFLPHAYPSTDRLYFINDSDELAIISLTEEAFSAPYIGENHHLDAAFIAQWAEACAAPMHKMSFTYYTIWHEHEINQDQWQPVINRSQNTALEVLTRLSMPEIVLYSENNLAYLARLDRAKRYGGLRPTETQYLKRKEQSQEAYTKLTLPSGIYSLLRSFYKWLPTSIQIKIGKKFKNNNVIFAKKRITITLYKNI